VVENALHDPRNRTKEYVIGVEVFDRGSSYNPSTDPIVRIQAGRLRSKLAEYYRTEGEHDPLVIELPKGTYVPVFHEREQPRLAEAPASVEAVPPIQRPNSRRKLFVVGAVALLIGLTVAVLSLPKIRESRRGIAGPISLAVLPFLNLTGSAQNDYLSDGFTEELTTALAGVDGLRVVARTSAFQFRGKAADVREIGEQLGVGAIIEGSVNKFGDRLRITAQLVSTANGYHLWSGAYDGERNEIYSIEEQIARQTILILRVPGKGREQTLLKGRTENPEAHDLYLQGRYFWYMRDLRDMEKALQYFQAAAKKDPNYALAHLGIAETYVVMAGNGQKPYAEVMPLARTAVNRTLELDPSLAQAHLTLAMLIPPFSDRAGIEREFQRAVELSPGYATAHHWYGVILSGMGRFQEADVELRKAQILDPLSPMITEGLAENFYYWRRYDSAIEQVQRIRAMGSKLGGTVLGLAYIQKARYEEAIGVFERLPQGDEAGKRLAYLACAYAASGQKEQARKLLKQASDSGNGYVPPSLTAMAYVLLGDKEAAIRWLEKAYEQSDPSVAIKDPILDPIRSDPRFGNLVRKMGYADSSEPRP
jgi:TolB-like protein/Flp pilus assembly protein TadD